MQADNGPSIPLSGLVFLMDPANLRTYPGSGTITIPVANGGQSIYTGYAQNNGVYGSFTMGPLHVYSKTLSNVEIQQNFNAYRSRYGI